MEVILAAVQFGGGALGLVMSAYIIPPLADSSGRGMLVLLAFLTPLFWLASAAGALLWLEFPIGRPLSLLCWLLQLPVLASATFGYFVNIVLAWRFLDGPTGLTSFIFFGSQFHWSVQEGTAGTTLGLNVVPLLPIALLFRRDRPVSVPVDGVAPITSA